MDRETRSTVVMLVLVACVATLSYGAAAIIVGTPAIVADGLCYNAAAMRLLNTGVYSYLSLDIDAAVPPNAFITPGYILLLAGMYVFLPHTGDANLALTNAIPFIVGLHFAFAVGTAVIVAATGQLVGGRRMGLTAGLLAAAYLPFGAEAMSGWSENVGMFFTACSVLLAVGLLKAPPRRQMAWMVAFGVCGGITVMFRPVMALWLGIPLVLWWWLRRSQGSRAIGLALVGVACIVAIMAPWWIRNAVVFGRFVPLTTHAGTVWIDSVGGISMDAAEQRVFDEAMRRGEDGYAAVAFRRLAAQWRGDPVGFVAGRTGDAVRMVLRPWSSLENPASPLPRETARVTLPSYRLLSPAVYRTWMAALGVIHLIALMLALVGLFVGRRDVRAWLVASVPLYIFIVCGVMGPRTRYFYPAMSAVVLLAGVGLLAIAEIVPLWREGAGSA